jgi:hypothetical protein
MSIFDDLSFDLFGYSGEKFVGRYAEYYLKSERSAKTWALREPFIPGQRRAVTCS